MKTSPRQANGAAVLVGVNKLDPGHYGTSCVDLLSPDKDVEDYELIAKLNGLTTQILQAENATRSKLVSTLAKTAKTLKAGDFLLLTFSGYGGQVINFDGNLSEQLSATWCLQNGQLLYPEIFQVLSDFTQGVNILIVSDTSSPYSSLNYQHINPANADRQRSLPVEIAETVYLKNKDQYDSFYLGSKSNPTISANVIWLTGCQVNQVAFESNYNGYLTAAIKHTWNGGTFLGSYESFFKEVSLNMPVFQSPKITTYGEDPNQFLKKRTFTF